MPSKKVSKSKTGFFGVRKKPSGNFSVEFQCDSYRYWIGTFDSVDMAARAYDIAAWRFGRPRHEMNFPEIETQADAELIGPKNLNIRRMDEKEEKKKKRPAILVAPGNSDDAAMARFAREHPEYVHAEREFFWNREAEQKKKGVKKEEEAGPSTVIPVESDSSDWDDSEEDDDKCDDPSKGEFWEQFKSDDE